MIPLFILVQTETDISNPAPQTQLGGIGNWLLDPVARCETVRSARTVCNGVN